MICAFAVAGLQKKQIKRFRVDQIDFTTNLVTLDDQTVFPIILTTLGAIEEWLEFRRQKGNEQNLVTSVYGKDIVTLDVQRWGDSCGVFRLTFTSIRLGRREFHR